MAQANSAQREPSMEEILASIRRIIEDSDTIRQPFDDAERAQFPLEDGASGMQQQVEAFRVELDAPQPVAEFEVPQPAVENIFIPPVSAEPKDVASDEMPEAALAPASPAQVKEAEPFDITSLVIDEAQPSAEQHFKEEAGIDVSQPGLETAESRPSLISDQAGRQVAAAFGELSEAFAASRRRSFDEMAEEMLRPMLQDWLDNNLPMLVERLVREEIERVARGG